ncbi:hypothetical protein [Streptomyces caniscabiei]|uniref:hypothetical protein n=1 Tax=Streptomyces caniscabiei TaxID=2746961 RepID=UPI0029AE5171|nr:hypothetical protein [Streptomyces caniscabiei]MDX2986428.1 hypothetical protein [Streptomyces caniscabiei]
MTDQTDVHDLTDDELLPMMVSNEYRNREKRRGHTILLHPFPPCTVCHEPVLDQPVSEGVDPFAERLVVNRPCGHRLRFTLEAAERLVDQVQHIVNVAEARPAGSLECSGEEGFCDVHGFHRHPPVPEGDVCRPVDIDGETVRVRGKGELTEQGLEALTALVRVAKAKFDAEAPEQVGVLQNRLRLAHKARRAKEHQLDDIRRALYDIGLIQDDDPYGHADLADVIRQAGEHPAADALAAEWHRRHQRLEQLTNSTGPEAQVAIVEHVRGELVGLRGALGILLGGQVEGGTADLLGWTHYQEWLRRQEDQTKEGNRS